MTVSSLFSIWLLAGAAARRASFEQPCVAIYPDHFEAYTIVVWSHPFAQAGEAEAVGPTKILVA